MPYLLPPHTTVPRATGQHSPLVSAQAGIWLSPLNMGKRCCPRPKLSRPPKIAKSDSPTTSRSRLPIKKLNQAASSFVSDSDASSHSSSLPTNNHISTQNSSENTTKTPSLPPISIPFTVWRKATQLVFNGPTIPSEGISAKSDASGNI